MIFTRNHEILRTFMSFHKSQWFPCISQDFGPAALVRKKDSNSYAFSMVAVLIFLPGHCKISFSMKILVPKQNFRDFHEICWILGAESDFPFHRVLTVFESPGVSSRERATRFQMILGTPRLRAKALSPTLAARPPHHTDLSPGPTVRQWFRQ